MKFSGVYKLAEELGVNEVKIKTAQVYNYINGNPLIPLNDKYSRYRKTSWDYMNLRQVLTKGAGKCGTLR